MTRGRSLALVACCVALVACARLLGLHDDGSAPFPHRKHVLAGVSCDSCHGDMSKNPTALHLPSDASCLTCHEKPHDERPCSGCHVATGAIAALVEAREHLRFDHGQHLLGPARGNCMRCHGGVAEGDTRLRPSMATCFTCHEAEKDARTCDSCHRDLEGERTLPATHLAHDGDWLREHGTRAASSGDLCSTCHTQSSCAKCHGQSVPALEARVRFADPFAASVHRAGFAARHALEARSDPGSCATCHQPERCLGCHQQKGLAGAARRSPHPAGWVGLDNLHGPAARRDPAECASCHGGAGEKMCVKCHAVGGVGGSPHPPGWSSELPLGAMPCRMCHLGVR
jgi:hypothetical protein